MWRRSLHNRLRYFDENYVIGSDYEVRLRIADDYPMRHSAQFLYLFYRGKAVCSLKSMTLCVGSAQR